MANSNNSSSNPNSTNPNFLDDPKIEQLAKDRFNNDKDFRSAVLSVVYRAHPPGPKCLIDMWQMCKKLLQENNISEKEINDNIGIEIKIRGPVQLIHTCDVSCEVKSSWNSAKQETLKHQIQTLGFVYKGSFKQVLMKLKEVFPITFQC